MTDYLMRKADLGLAGEEEPRPAGSSARAGSVNNGFVLWLGACPGPGSRPGLSGNRTWHYTLVPESGEDAR